jgi:hypothetical protein
MAIKVHWKTGPGLIESVYAALKCLELDKPAFLITHKSPYPKGIKSSSTRR